jgi:hypothetical protein
LDPCFTLLLFFLIEPFFRFKHEASIGWEGYLVISFAWLSLWFVLMLTGKTILTLGPSAMTVQHRPFRFKPSSIKFPPGQLNHLRFVVASNREEIRNEFGQSEIQIDREFRTHHFAEGITEQEADALIEKMMEVYDFSRDATR